MFKLIKYEFRKNRTGLIVMFLICLGMFLMAPLGKVIGSEEMMIIPMVLLPFYALAAYIYVLIRGIKAYSSELKNRSGYLLMMVPRSTMSILFSKLLFTLFFAVVLFIFSAAALFGVYNIVADVGGVYNLQASVDFFRFGLIQIGVTLEQLIITLAYFVVETLISLLVVVSIGYLSVTLGATLLFQKKLQGFLNFVIFVVLLLALTFLNNMVTPPAGKLYQTYEQAILAGLPSTILNFVLTVIFTSLSALLLKKKVCL